MRILNSISNIRAVVHYDRADRNTPMSGYSEISFRLKKVSSGDGPIYNLMHV